MFDTVMGRAQGNKRRFGTGALVSVAFHGGLLAGALWLSSGGRTPEAVKRYAPPVVVLVPPSQPPVAVDMPPAVVPDRPRVRPNKLVQPKHVDELKEPKVEPRPEPQQVTSANPENTSQSSNQTTGPATGPVTGVEIVGSGGGGSLLRTLDFGVGMTRPVQLEGRDPEYTPDALRARVEGSIIARCVITVEGTLQNCRILKSLPFMDEAVLSALATRRYQPVTYQGAPVPVNYDFRIRMMLPGH